MLISEIDYKNAFERRLQLRPCDPRINTAKRHCRRQPLRGKRAYFLVTPERGEERPVMTTFLTWLLEAVEAATQAV